MAMKDILSEANIAKAIDSVKQVDSFDYKKFFEVAGIKGQSQDNVHKIFHILDKDKSGFIEEEELRDFLKCFVADSRVLSDKETKEFLKAGDKDNDGKISGDEFVSMVTAL
ncbi:parvalbumin alpha [Protopterus annectens]|uniref:parvalbumin alpha n=1 Tax=Protopterus annectens TaxID=7888 RepID=UPI001CF9EDCD|nr:parvalbumin alpha [Protopterus annectens]